MKIDPYKNKERYLIWKESVKEGIQNVTRVNSEIILRYLEDMETGVNISNLNVKGPRSYTRLNNLREKMDLIVRPVPPLYRDMALYDERMKEKKWNKIWPKLKIIDH